MKDENIRKVVGGKPLPSSELKKMFEEFVKKNGLGSEIDPKDNLSATQKSEEKSDH